MSYLSENSYLAVKPESTAGTAVIPTNFVPLVNESIRAIVNHTADKRIKGVSWNSNDLLRGSRSQEGEVVILADPDNLGHFLNMFMLKGTTTGDATDGYTHPFTVGDCDSYSFEISRGAFAQRFFGVKVNELRLEFADGNLQVRADIKAVGQFSVAKLGVALTGAGMTSMTLDDEYDLEPTRGLVVGDTLVIGTDEVIITAITDTKTVEFASADLTYSIGEPVYLKSQTVTLPSLQDPFYFGNTLVGVGADETEATTNAGSRSTATPVHDLSVILRNNILEIPRSGRVDPIELKTRSKQGQIQMKQLLESEDNYADFLARTKQAITIIIKGKYIKSDFTTNEQLTLKFHNVKLTENSNKLEVGEYIVDDQNFEVLYDNTDGKAMTADLINRTAGTAY